MNIKIYDNKIVKDNETFSKEYFKKVSLKNEPKLKFEFLFYILLISCFFYMLFNFSYLNLGLFILFCYGLLKFLSYDNYVLYINNGFVPFYESTDKKEIEKLRKDIENFMTN